MDLGIAGKVALVTASSRGLGFATALALSEAGCAVTICARDAARLEAAAEALPGEVLAIPIDVTEPGSADTLAAATRDRFGGLDILFANAGGPPPARALEAAPEGIEAAVATNLTTPVRLVQASLPTMRANRWGRIVLNTSWGVKQPIPGLAYSNIARTGLWAWAKTAAQDLIEDGITLNLLAPGPHDTDRARELGLSGPMGDAGDFGRIAAFLCSAHTAFVSGVALQVDGAATLGLL